VDISTIVGTYRSYGLCRRLQHPRRRASVDSLCLSRERAPCRTPSNRQEVALDALGSAYALDQTYRSQSNGAGQMTTVMKGSAPITARRRCASLAVLDLRSPKPEAQEAFKTSQRACTQSGYGPPPSCSRRTANSQNARHANLRMGKGAGGCQEALTR
jgi:hypothetical protein